MKPTFYNMSKMSIGTKTSSIPEKNFESGTKSGQKKRRRKRGKGAEKRHGIDRTTKYATIKLERKRSSTQQLTSRFTIEHLTEGDAQLGHLTARICKRPSGKMYCCQMTRS